MLLDFIWFQTETTLIVIIFLALFLDIIWGEVPVSIHPVVWMGKVIDLLKPYLIKLDSKLSGFLLTLILTIFFIVPVMGILFLIKFNLIIDIIISSLILSTTFSINFLLKSAKGIETDLEHNLEKARKSVSYLVSRDTKSLSEDQVISATVETLTENITDSVVSPLFFAFLFGIPGAVFFRVINTLDAMVGYKNKENLLIGWFPAKLDDVLNYVPARITGLIMVLAAWIGGMDWKNSFKIMMRDARSPPSPNSGFSMAAAAGALEIKLEKPGVYVIGDDLKSLDIKTVSEALKLTKITIIMFMIIFTILYLIFSYFVFTTFFYMLY